MRYTHLNEKQLAVIGHIVEGIHNISEICAMCNVGRRTYYDWRKQEYFINALNQMLEEKKNTAVDHLKGKVEDFLGTLDDLRKKSKNDMVRYHAARELLGLSGVVVTNKEELVFKSKDDKEAKSKLLTMLDQKRKLKLVKDEADDSSSDDEQIG